ncbi:MAG: hypothetical protein KUG75_11355 [Pseudomonadales bacterium]|nr:hypothetical protein [Pseudomonadales bacterium]
MRIILQMLIPAGIFLVVSIILLSRAPRRQTFTENQTENIPPESAPIDSTSHVQEQQLSVASIIGILLISAIVTMGSIFGLQQVLDYIY